ncbi:cupin domain-containing protein [Streptomyces monticola]|uniref:Cupin domain-containing protein n=1 Tax=Streptomyces monticola TaxID=2666263 RepID=A0ABW2JDX4_9ACTN
MADDTSAAPATGDAPEISSLGPLAEDLLRKAAESRADRSARTVVGGRGHVLSQTLMAFGAGTSLAEHENPGEATVIVVRGRVRLTVGDDFWEAAPYDLVVMPDAMHGLVALEDSVVLLTVAKRQG